MHDGTCRVGSESREREDAPGCVLDLAECLQASWSYARACKVERLILALCGKENAPRTCAEHVSSVADSPKITSSTWKRCLVRAEFEKYFGKWRHVRVVLEEHPGSSVQEAAVCKCERGCILSTRTLLRTRRRSSPCNEV